MPWKRLLSARSDAVRARLLRLALVPRLEATKKSAARTCWTACASRLKPAIELKWATPGVVARMRSISWWTGLGALQRRGVGQLNVDEEVALVLSGMKPVGSLPPDEGGGRAR